MSDAGCESSMEHEDEDDDAEYYRQEVGQEPDPGTCLCTEIHSSWCCANTLCLKKNKTLDFLS